MGVTAAPGVSASGRGPYYPKDHANGVVQGTIAAIGPSRPFGFLGPMNLAIWGEFVATLTTTAGSLNATVSAAGAIAAGAAVFGANIPYGATIGTIAGTDVTLLLPTYTFWGSTKAGVALITGISDTSKLGGATVAGLGFVGTETVTVGTPSIAPSLGFPSGSPGTLIPSVAPTIGASFKTMPEPFEFTLAASGAVATGADAAAIFTSAAIGLTGAVQLERSFDGGKRWTVCNIGSSGGLAQWNPATPINLSFGEPEQGVLYRLNTTALTPSAGTSLKYRISETGQAARSLSIPTL